MSKIIGIDLGTTNSVVAVWQDGRPRVLPNASGNQTTPSVVGFTDDGGRLVGDPARSQQVTNPERTVYSIKRFMGRRHHEVQGEEKIVPYPIVGRADEYVKIKVGRKLFTPQEISALILREIKEQAQAELGEAVDKAVLTVPAYFNDAQRKATKDAGAIAGLTVERIVNEPTAAALAYGLEKRENKCIAVFDFGGGTLDLAALNIGGGKFEVVGVHGNTHLGGDDFDQRIIDIVADDYRRRETVDIRQEPMALQRLKEAAEKAKTELSGRLETTIMLPFISVGGSGAKHLQHEMSRETFEAVCKDLFDEVRDGCRTLLAEARLNKGDIAEIVMVGGSTRMPIVEQIAKQIFGTTELDKSINPDEVVAQGAAILGGVLSGEVENVNLMDVNSRSLGVETAGGRMTKLIVKNSSIPTKVKHVFSTPRNNQTSVPIHVLEGEGAKAAAKENRTLAEFQLRGIPKAPAGKPQIEVEFEIDLNGILKVSATDQWTSKSQDVVIKGAVGLDKAEIERMKVAAEEIQSSNEERQSKADLRNHAETVHHDVQKWLEYNGAMMPIRERTQIESALKKLEKRIEKNDFWGMRTALKKLEEVSLPIRKAG